MPAAEKDAPAARDVRSGEAGTPSGAGTAVQPTACPLSVDVIVIDRAGTIVGRTTTATTGELVRRTESSGPKP
ncbi:hypothetical protein [Saccharopolyspora shandongensis]|uniref:hypothetical protein n=1 Tax=Saccharopolyspora shandongensis TaxID=418495 RepID=UPI0033D93725